MNIVRNSYYGVPVFGKKKPHKSGRSHAIKAELTSPSIPAEDFWRVAITKINLSNRLKKYVKFVFKGTPFIIRPGTDPDKLIKAYEKKVKL